jgi:hypothetical protein
VATTPDKDRRTRRARAGALARSRLGARTVISGKAYFPLSRRAFASGLATGLRLRLLRWWLNHLQLRRTGWFLRLTCRSAGRFQLGLGQDRRGDGRRQRGNVLPAWRRLHVGDDRSGQRLESGQTRIGNAYGLKQSVKTQREQAATAQYRQRWMPSAAATPSSCCRYAPGMEGERRLTAFVPQSFARVPTLRGWSAERSG